MRIFRNRWSGSRGTPVATIYRQLAPNYITREIFATKREELRITAANAITTRLGSRRDYCA